MPRALIVQGGWDGHEPVQVAELFREILKTEKFDVTVSDTLETFEDTQLMEQLDLIVPVWTMGEISEQQEDGVLNAVANGTGIAGCHGGMCDAFRNSVRWQFMTGGNWVAHPGGDGIQYTINFRTSSSPLTEGMKDFSVTSEQYYLHVDPAVEVLATTRFPTEKWFHSANGEVDMPVIWTKRWGLGRVFYCSLGHHADIAAMPEVREIMRRGFLWCSEGKEAARRKGLDATYFESSAKMF